MNVLDLFSGIGGFSLGLERAGMKTVAFCEMDSQCQRVLQKQWPEIPIIPDVRKLTLKTIEKIQSEAERCARSSHEMSSPPRFKKIDLICGGFPCQDISVAGKKRGIEGERSGLWGEFHRIIETIRPRYVIIENVSNLRSQGLAKVLKDLWSIGYDSEWYIISARSVGAPHLRERVWIVAYSTSLGDRGVSDQISRESKKTKGEKSREELKCGSSIEGGFFDSPDSHLSRFGESFTSKEASLRWWSKAAACVSHWEEAQSIICGVDDGIPRKLDKPRRERVKQLGNAVLPQIPELIGRRILEFEARMK